MSPFLVPISQWKPLSPMNLLFNQLIRITGKNDRQTSEPNEFNITIIKFRNKNNFLSRKNITIKDL